MPSKQVVPAAKATGAVTERPVEMQPLPYRGAILPSQVTRRAAAAHRPPPLDSEVVTAIHL
ncbi:hypothetical protein L1856_06540 [Streptomyces sp. Tue 6430]|nr:hypothetical protein [Streptomyces sp. Tue 6430]